MSYPDDCQYSEDHEWVSTGSPVHVGITEFAARALDEAVYVDLPEVGSEVTAGQACGEIESMKSVSDSVTPADGKVVAVNQDAADNPKLATDDPHGTWLCEIEVAELPELVDSTAYEAFAREA